MAGFLEGLIDKAKRVGYDTRLGPTGSFTYRTGSNPLTVPVTGGGFPGMVMVPEDRPLTKEEVAHESTHVTGGAPMAVAGKLLGGLLGTGATAGYTDPDEALSYLSQPASPDTTADMKTLGAVSKGIPNWYGRLLESLSARKAAQGQ